MQTTHDRSAAATHCRRIPVHRRAVAGAVVSLVVGGLLCVAGPPAAAADGETARCTTSGMQAHLVVSGDTWYGIAESAGVSMRSLLDTNEASVDDVIRPDDVVCLPPGASSSSSCPIANAPTYTVASGDTWWDIARRAGVSTTSLLSANGASESRMIHPGSLVCLPPGSSVNSAPPSASSSGTGPDVRDQPPALAALPMRGPCWFGDSWGAPRGGERRHQGVDLFAEQGSHVYAVADGTLTRRAWDQPGRRAGNAWWLTADDGTYYFYAHLADFAPDLAVGSRVEAGQIIGFMGETGNAAFPHLHFEIHPHGGSAVNPYPVLRPLGGCKRDGGYTQPNGWIPD